MATIEFVPVCGYCGERLHGLIDCREMEPLFYTDKYNMIFKDKNYSITPFSCPKCDAVFTQIRMPRKLPYDAE